VKYHNSDVCSSKKQKKHIFKFIELLLMPNVLDDSLREPAGIRVGDPSMTLPSAGSPRRCRAAAPPQSAGRRQLARSQSDTPQHFAVRGPSAETPCVPIQSTNIARDIHETALSAQSVNMVAAVPRENHLDSFVFLRPTCLPLEPISTAFLPIKTMIYTFANVCNQ